MNRILDDREICDLECLSIGAFAPLKSYMTKCQYELCLSSMKISDTDVFPIPITLGMDQDIPEGTLVHLVSSTGIIHATLDVLECWKADISAEYHAIFGSDDDNHPYIAYQKSRGLTWYVSGALQIINPIEHNRFEAWRKTPAEMRQLGPWIGFQTRNPLHRSHIELIKRAAQMVPGGHILLHPVEGVTQDCDIPFSVRMQCYKKVLPELGESTQLSILPLSMRMAGPREAVWHAVIRRNYGCSHFIVGRDHAGPSYRKKDGAPFFHPLAAQQLAKSLETQIGINILDSEELAYCEDIQAYLPISQTVGRDVRNISGTELRRRLTEGESIPAWFSYPGVVAILQKYYAAKRGICFYFVGLSGSGKSTLAESLRGWIEEEYPDRTVTLLDADIVRTHLSKGLGFSREDRSLNVRRIGYVASEIVKHGGICIVANIAPYAEDRAFNRALISEYGEYVEVFVDTPIEECERRDVKGLYAAARAGKIAAFTGVSDPFEVPDHKATVCIPQLTKAATIRIVHDLAGKYIK